VVFGIASVIGVIFAMLGINSEDGIGSIIMFVIELTLIPMTVGYIYYIIKLINGGKLSIKEALLSKYNKF